MLNSLEPAIATRVRVLPSSKGGPASINHQIHTRDVGGSVGRQKDNSPFDVFVIQHTPDWNSLAVVPDKGVGLICKESSRRKAIGANALLAVVIGNVTCEIDHAGLDKVIVRRVQHVCSFVESWIACHDAVDTRDIDDRTVALANHIGYKSPAHGKQSDHVPPSAVQPIVRRLGFKAATHARECAVHQNIETAKCLDDYMVKTFDRSDVG